MMKAQKRLAMVVLWPSFLAAAMAEGFFFSLFEPEALWDLAPMAIYSIGFFCFWTMCALASMLTFYLLAVPGEPQSPL